MHSRLEQDLEVPFGRLLVFHIGRSRFRMLRMFRSKFVVLALVGGIAACGGEESEDEPPSCNAMVQRYGELCDRSEGDQSITTEARCGVCSEDGELRWRACVDQASSCGEAEACQCSL